MTTVKQLTSIASILYRVLVGSYGISITLLLIGRLVFGEGLAAIAYMNSIIHLMLMPALILIVTAIIFRYWYIVGLLIPAVAAFSIWYVPYFTPKDAVIDAEPDFTILSYNVQAEAWNFEAVVQNIIEADADIVVIQELTFAAEAYLSQYLEEMYPEQALHPHQSVVVGQGVFSRYPIVDDTFWVTHLGHQRTEFDINGSIVTVYNAHAAFPFMANGMENRAEDVDMIVEMALAETNPTLIIGDFNMTERAEPYTVMTEHFHDVHREINQGFGFTYIPFFANFAMARIDYAFTDDRLTATEFIIMDNPGRSDHHPIKVAIHVTTNSP